MKFSLYIFILVLFHWSYGGVNEGMLLNPSDFGCIPEEVDAAEGNSECFQKMFDYSMLQKRQIIILEAKTYYISKELKINDFLIANLGGTTLIATDSINMISLDMKGSRWKGVLKNFRLNLNSVARCGIYGIHPEKFRITDGEIFGIGTLAAGIEIDKGFELFIDNVHFRGNQMNANGIILRTSDCHVSNVVLIDCQNGIVMVGSNFFNQIHGWIQNPNFLSNSSLFVAKIGSDNYISQSYSDTYENAFFVEGLARLHISEMKVYHNLDKWNSIDSTLVRSYVFRFREPRLVNGAKIFLLNSHIGSLLYRGKNRMKLSNYKMSLKKENAVFFEK